MNEKHLAWCKSHDWGNTATLNNGEITVSCVVVFFDGSEGTETETFSSFAELKAWAGY